MTLHIYKLQLDDDLEPNAGQAQFLWYGGWGDAERWREDDVPDIRRRHELYWERAMEALEQTDWDGERAAIGEGHVAALPSGQAGEDPVVIAKELEGGLIAYIISPLELPWLEETCVRKWTAKVAVSVTERNRQL